MPKYKKKPVVIEAYQLGCSHDVPDWFMDAVTNNKIVLHKDPARSPFDTSHDPLIVAEIETLEGIMKAQYQDYIIKGVAGEIYPCKPEIFKATYELAE